MVRWILSLLLCFGLVACASLQTSRPEWIDVHVRNLGWDGVVVYLANPNPQRIGFVEGLREATLQVRRTSVENQEVGFWLKPMASDGEWVPSVWVPAGVRQIKVRAELPDRSSISYFFF